ncbi:hypothetical protein WJ968_12665 [Achromobacter xylosoxidans]
MLLLSLLTLLLHAALGLGRAQLAAMQLGNSSRKAAMTAARGQAMSLHDVRNGVALRGVAQVARGGSASAASQSLRNDWLGEARLVQVRADTTVAMPPPFSGLRISRQVQVLSGAGHARDDADAQRRVGAASLSWRRVSQVSQERARAMGQLLETARSPWGRPALSMDWLAAWHDVATVDSLFADGGPVRLLLSPFFATSCSRGGARAASRFGSVAEICRRALAATLALTAGALPRAGAQTVQALWPDAATRGRVTDGMALAVTRPATPADLQLAAGARRQWLADRLWLHGQPAGVLVFDTPQDVPELIRSLSGQQPALVDLHVLPGQVLLSGKVGDAQWVAQMEAVGPRRTVGSISQVRLGAPAAFVPPAWLPADASLKLDFEIQEDERRVREQIWRSALSPRRAQALAQRRLRDAGWRAARVPAGAAQRWERDDAALQWTATPVEQGSGIWIRSWTR